MNVAEALVDLLASNGVTHVFGIGGDALNVFTDALRRDGRLTWIGMHHEENAAYAAYAQSAIGARPGVCAGTVGPGALHLINGLYDAKREGFAGVIALTGQLPHAERGTKYFQAVDLKAIYADVCAYQAIIAEPSQMPRIAEIALQQAIAEQQVVRVELPQDVLPQNVPSLHFRRPLVTRRSAVVPPADLLKEAATLVDAGKRVALFCGAGCTGAGDEIVTFAKKVGAPIAHTLRAKEIFEKVDGPVVGMTGLLGAPSGYHAVKDCDLLIMLGTNFPYDHFLPEGIPIIQVDRCVENIGVRAPVTLGVHGDVKATLDLLAPLVKERPAGAWTKALANVHARWIEHNTKQADPSTGKSPIPPPVVARLVSEKASDDAVFVIDGGSATVYLARYMRLHGRRRALSSFNHGSISGGLGMAIGASSVDPKRQVWLLTGDGCFGMMPQDLITAKHSGWPVKIVVFDNAVYDFVRMEMQVAGLPVDGTVTDLQNMDFVAFAQANGVEAVRVERAGEMAQAIDRALAAPGPFLIDAKTEAGLLSMPPHITAQEAWGFAASTVKEALLGLEGDHEQFVNWGNELKANLTATNL